MAWWISMDPAVIGMRTKDKETATIPEKYAECHFCGGLFDRERMGSVELSCEYWPSRWVRSCRCCNPPWCERREMEGNVYRYFQKVECDELGNVID
jgi:hypothetical protein